MGQTLFVAVIAKDCGAATCGACMKGPTMCAWTLKSSKCTSAMKVPMSAKAGEHVWEAEDCPPCMATDCGTCMSDKQCTWSTKSKKCVKFEKMPMSAKAGDYLIEAEKCPCAHTACGGCVSDMKCAWKAKAMMCMEAEMMPTTARMGEYLMSITKCPKSAIVKNMFKKSGDYRKQEDKYCTGKMGLEYDDLEAAKTACNLRSKRKRKACKGMFQSGCSGKYKLCRGSLKTAKKGACAYMY